MAKIKAIWSWFVSSSVAPEQWSLSLKGILASILPVAIMLAPVFGFNAGQDALAQAAQSIVEFVATVGAMVSGGVTAYGIGRKLVITFKGFF